MRYLKPWNWNGKQAWKWEDVPSYLMEYQIPAADVLRKMEHVQLNDDGRILFTLSTKLQVFTLGLVLGEKVFSFLTALVKQENTSYC